MLAQPSANVLAISVGGVVSLTIQNAITPDKGTPGTTHRRTLVALRLLGTLKTARVAVSADSRAPRRSAIILSVVFLSLFVLGNARSSYASSLVDQTPLNPSCIPMFDQTLHWADPLHSMGHSIERALQSSR